MSRFFDWFDTVAVPLWAVALIVVAYLVAQWLWMRVVTTQADRLLVSAGRRRDVGPELALVVAQPYRRDLEREGWYRVRPTYQKPAGGFLVVGPRSQGRSPGGRDGGPVPSRSGVRMVRDGADRAPRGESGAAPAAASMELGSNQA